MAPRAHAGLILVGIAFLDREGLAGASLYVVSHAFVKGALFFAVVILLHRFESVDELYLKGQGAHVPVAAVTMAAGAVGLAGVPVLGTFAGERLRPGRAGNRGRGRGAGRGPCYHRRDAPVAQLDRASAFEAAGRPFKSGRARQPSLSCGSLTHLLGELRLAGETDSTVL